MWKGIKKSMRPIHPGTTADRGKRMTSRIICPVLALAVLALTSGLAGCGSSSSNLIVNPSGTFASMPTPATATVANTYVGTNSIDMWSLSLDDSANSYSYTDTTSSSSPVKGTFTSANGFLNMGQTTSGTSLGLALEVQSRMALLRPGDATAGLVLSVPQTTCYSIPYRLLFNYIPMEAAPSLTHTFSSSNYASVVLNTDTTGAAWQYQDLEGSIASGSNSFTGTCAVANGQATMTVSGNSLFNIDNNDYSIQYTAGNTLSTSLAIGPSGVFVANQVDESMPLYQAHLAAGVAGVAEPTSALTTKTVAAGKYLGFLIQAATYLNGYGVYGDVSSTLPASFGPTSSSSTTMTGGTFPVSTAFPGGDVTQTPNTDTIITLGTQSSTTNGLYPKATVTMLDPSQNCTTWINQGNPGASSLTVGTDAAGYITCTFPAVAIVGNPEGKYVIFLDAFNYTANSVATQIGAPMQIYLFQQ